MESTIRHSGKRRRAGGMALRGAILAVLVLTTGVVQARAAGGGRPVSANRLLTNLQIQSLACPSARVCFVLGWRMSQTGPTGLVILATRNGGAGWSIVREQAGLLMNTLVCPDPRRCYALGNPISQAPGPPEVSFFRTTDGWKSWRQSKLKLGGSPGYLSAGLVCPSAATCYIAGTIFVPSPGGNGLNRVLLLVTTNGGQNWTQRAFSGIKTINPHGMACTSTTNCYVVSVGSEKSCFRTAVILHTGDGGRTWVRQLNSCAAFITALSCPSAHVCYAGGSFGLQYSPGNQLVLHTGDGGSVWDDLLVGPMDLPDNPGSSQPTSITSIACPNDRRCSMSVGHSFVTTADGGISWTINTIASNLYLFLMSCPTAQVCFSAGLVEPVPGPGPSTSTGAILRTVDGGKTWTGL